MKNAINHILMAYRPLYMRGLLMDGHYQFAKNAQEPPVKGRKVIRVVPVFEPRRVREVHVTPLAAFGNVFTRMLAAFRKSRRRTASWKHA